MVSNYIDVFLSVCRSLVIPFGHILGNQKGPPNSTYILREETTIASRDLACEPVSPIFRQKELAYSMLILC